MRWPGAASIRSKLIWLTTAISVAGIVMVTAFNAWHAYQSRRDALRQELTAVAGILAANLEAPLLFGDRRAAQETLSTLGSRPLVVYARLEDANGGAFASHGVLDIDVEWHFAGFRETEQYALLTLAIQRGGRPLGRLQLCGSLAGLHAAVRQTLLISGAMMAVAGIVAWLMARLLGQAISRPIEHLATTMQQVSGDRDFSRRAKRTGDDEVGTLIDGFNEMIATIQQYHDDLAEARDRAEHANRSKSRFLATMSHELRTPLNAIMGFSEIVAGGILGDLPSKYRSYGTDIHGSARYLMNLIDDLLDMSRLDSGGYSVHEEEFAVSTAVSECEAMIRPQAEAKRISLTVSLVDPDLLVRADHRGFRQVILNLLGNAIKFTPSGGCVQVRGRPDQAGGYEISVTDNGPGIPEEDIERVLEPFEQVRSHLSREHGGTGLGLAISRAIMQAHGGTLELVSRLGDGTMARLRLPASRVVVADDTDAGPGSSPPGDGGSASVDRLAISGFART